ncbi:MAG: hypothetical protein IH865_13260 [Chloroflexi bacterium]|nr:hypothetical protein [Chloroflexota bacterium]
MDTKRIAPSLANFFAVQILDPQSKGRLLGGPYVSVGALSLSLCAAYLVGSALGRTHRDDVDELVKMFSDEPDSPSQLDIAKSAYSARAAERLELSAGSSFGGGGERTSFFHLVLATTTQVLAAMGAQGEFVAVAMPGEYVEPEEKKRRAAQLAMTVHGVSTAEVCASGQKVKYEPRLVAFYAAITVAEGILLGATEPDLTATMASNDLALAAQHWERYKSANIAERPPFADVTKLDERAEFELQFFRSARTSDPTGRHWGGAARLASGEYDAWTKRSLGIDLVATYVVHAGLTLSNAAQ